MSICEGNFSAHSSSLTKGGVTYPWKSPIVLAPLFSGLFLIGLFCFWEWKGAKLPIVPMYIFRHLTVTGVYIAMFINGFIFFSTLIILPQYFQAVLRYTPIGAGVFLIPFLVSQMVANWAAGMIITKTGHYRMIIYCGFAVWTIGLGLISTTNTTTSKGAQVIFMLLTGFGGGLTLQTTTIAAQAAVPKRDMAVVTAFRNFVRLLGGTLSLAVGSTIVNNSLRSSMAVIGIPARTSSAIVQDPSVLSNPSSIGLTGQQATFILQHGYTKGFRALFILHASLAALATLTSILMIKHKDLTREESMVDQTTKSSVELTQRPVNRDVELANSSVLRSQ